MSSFRSDYSDRASVLVVKRPGMFGFRNPGLMRIPAEIAIHGAEHDCRNRTLHKMFRFVGVGEQAGSGIPKNLWWMGEPTLEGSGVVRALRAVRSDLVELQMMDLVPRGVLARLRVLFGKPFDELGKKRANHVGNCCHRENCDSLEYEN